MIFDKLHEECGVFGVITRSGEDVVPMTYRALYALCLLYTSPSPRDLSTSRMPSSA